MGRWMRRVLMYNTIKTFVGEWSEWFRKWKRYCMWVPLRRVMYDFDVYIRVDGWGEMLNVRETLYSANNDYVADWNVMYDLRWDIRI